MTTLVTGATGFIGGNLARALTARGEEVRALVRPASNDLAIRDTNVKQAPGDLTDAGSLDRAMAGCETVYHCAAVYSFWNRRARQIVDANVQGTRNVLDAARRAGVRRLVFTSSVSTIGLPGDAKGDPDGPLGCEEMMPEPRHLIGNYKRSKFESEKLALEANGTDLEVVVVNPCAPVGRWDVKPTPTGRIPLDFARGRMPAYLATGLNLVDVDDVADGHILAMEKGRPGERYILGNANLTLRQIFEILADITGREPPRFRTPFWLALAAAYLDQWVEGGLLQREPSIPVEAVRISRHPMYVNCAKAINELGMPQSPVDVALQKAIEWFVDYGYLPARTRAAPVR